MDLLTACCDLIKEFEGFRSEPYQNPGDRPTIGWGSTFYESGAPVTMSDDPVDYTRAQQILEFYVQKSMEVVQELACIQLTDNQIIALTSFEYNTGHLKGSTLLMKLNAEDFEGAAAEFPRWVHEGPKVLSALVTRRNHEAKLFLTPDNT